jgi:hypothetical protein
VGRDMNIWWESHDELLREREKRRKEKEKKRREKEEEEEEEEAQSSPVFICSSSPLYRS